MPHLTLEYTSNIEQEIQVRALFSQLHQILADLGIRMDNCKSRAVRLDRYYVGAGETRNAFVHLDIRFLEGKAPDAKQEIGRQSLKLLEEHFASSFAELQLQITVEIRDIERHAYFKVPEGTL